MKFSKYLVELEMGKKLERKGYAVMKISRTCNLLVGNRTEIFIILVKKSRGRRVIIPQNKALIDLGGEVLCNTTHRCEVLQKGMGDQGGEIAYSKTEPP